MNKIVLFLCLFLISCSSDKLEDSVKVSESEAKEFVKKVMFYQSELDGEKVSMLYSEDHVWSKSTMDETDQHNGKFSQEDVKSYFRSLKRNNKKYTLEHNIESLEVKESKTIVKLKVKEHLYEEDYESEIEMDQEIHLKKISDQIKIVKTVSKETKRRVED